MLTLNPSEGMRLLLERLAIAEDGSQAEYRALIYTPTECFQYGATLSMEGEARLEARGDSADAEMEKGLSNIARSTARAARRKVDEGLPPWPPRVLRWRGPGRG
jgi:hypothetical protein